MICIWPQILALYSENAQFLTAHTQTALHNTSKITQRRLIRLCISIEFFTLSYEIPQPFAPKFLNEIQPWPLAYKRLPNKPYLNEVTLTRQNPPLKCCQLLELFTQFKRGLDLSMLKIWGLQVKGLQIYQPSKFENDLTPVHLELGPTSSGVAWAIWQTFL